MALSRTPGPAGGVLGRINKPGGPGSVSPRPLGLEIRSPIFAAPRLAQVSPPKAASNKALIVIGDGHDSMKQGVRLKNDKYFDQAALTSFAAYTKGYTVTLVHVNSAADMKRVIEKGSWDVVIYFGHGVMNQMALAPKETGKRLSKEDLESALQTAGAKKVYLFGCRAGWTGLARQLSKSLPGATVFGTFGTLDVEWEQRKDADSTFTNQFIFKEGLTEFTSGAQTEGGKKTKTRRQEMGDPIQVTDSPIGEDPEIAQ